MPKEKNDDLNAVLQDAGAGDLVGEFDDLPPLPKGEEKEAVDDDDQVQDEEDQGSEDNLLADLGLLDEEEELDEEDEEGEQKEESREALLSRDNGRLYQLVDRLLQDRQRGTVSDGDEEPEAPAVDFKFDLDKLKTPAGVDESEYREEVAATAPILSEALNQFATQLIIPLVQNQARVANIVGDMHLSKNLEGWDDPELKASRDKIFNNLPPKTQAALQNEAGAALMTLAAQGLAKAKKAKKAARNLVRQRGVTEQAGGTGKREAPDGKKRTAAIKRFTRQSSDEEFEASLERIESGVNRR